MIDYRAINREYDDIRLNNERLHFERVSEVNTNVEGYKELSDKTAEMGPKMLKASLSGQGNIAEYKKMLKEIAEKKGKLLSDAGYPADYLDSIYTCKECKDTGYVEQKKCKCRKMKEAEYLYEESNIKELLENNNFSKFREDYYTEDEMECYYKILEHSVKYVEDFKSSFKNLLFYGDVGSGKTFFSCCIAKALMDRGTPTIHITTQSLQEKMFAQMREPEKALDIQKYLEYLENIDLLILDDFGAEHMTKYWYSKLLNIINIRMIKRLPIIYTTNLSLNDILEKYGDRIFSRLYADTDIIEFIAKDIRLQNRHENNVTM